jgi:glyoxylase-like metal-dependent hydrolase (beta-lactamase superfamily II)
VGTINSYFFERPFPTLVDVPPNDLRYKEILEEKLNKKGYSINNIKRIIVTHPHFDHFGCAKWIVEQSEAEVYALRGGAKYLEDFETELSADFAYYRDFLKKAGVPKEPDAYLGDFYQWAKTQGCNVRVSRYLEDGDHIELESALWKVVHVPGHTPWCIMLWEPSRRIALTGDFLIKEITSNAVIQRPHKLVPEYKSLNAYISSLKKVKSMALARALPGHGDRIENPTTQIKGILGFIQERKQRVLDLLTTGPQTPFQLMEALFPNIPDWEVMLGISEIIGYIELLLDEGSVRSQDGTPILFSPVPRT